MILKAILCFTMATFIITLIILQRVFGLKGLLIYELSVFEDFMKTRIDSFLDVFRKSKKINDGK